jgi:hypothetical protein
MARIFRTVLAFGVPMFLAAAVHAAPLSFRATLTGAQEVPAVDEPTRGTASFRFDPGLGTMRYELRVTSGVGVTQAHLHCAQAGVNGPVVVFLFGPDNTGLDVTGKLASGTITNADVIATESDLCGKPLNNIASLYDAILEGRVYANVHTTAHASGVVRAQLFP